MRAISAPACVALLLAGCAAAPIAPPDLRLPSAFQARAAEARTLAPAALDRWWTLFDDPQLTALVETALVRSPDARTGLQRILEARATRAQTLSTYLPQGDLAVGAQNQNTTESFGNVGVAAGALASGAASGATDAAGASAGGAGGAFLTPSGTLQTYSAQFNISYELDVFGRRRAAGHAADADLAAARFDAEAVNATLARDVAIDLFQARGDAMQLSNARETLRIAHDLARSAALSASRGLTSTSDAARLETDQRADEAEVFRLQAAVATAERTLLTLVGRGADPLESLTVEAVTTAPPAAPAATPGQLLARRPDVREAQARLVSATASYKLDRLALFPTFSLAPGGQYARTEGSYQSTTTVWSLGLNAALPILDRPRLLAAIRGQRARAEEAAIAYEQTVQNAYRDAENGLAATSADDARVRVLRRGVERARFAFDAKKRGYDLGLVDLTTLLDAERTWRTNLLTLTTAQTSALVDAATLFQALGGGWAATPTTLASMR